MTLRSPGAIFGFEQHKTNASREILAGLTTFTTMSYIVLVNPAILANAGIPVGPSFVAAVLVAIFGCVCFTFNIAVGITAGFVFYPLCKLAGGKIRQIKPALWVLTGLSLLFFIFYPYG